MTVKKIASVPNGDCVVLIQWMPPSIALSSVRYYVVNSPSGSSITRNTSIALFIHHCVLDTHISVHAVDYCDRDGPSTDIHVNILSQVLEVPDVKSTSVPTGTGLIYHPERSRSSHGEKFYNSYVLPFLFTVEDVCQKLVYNIIASLIPRPLPVFQSNIGSDLGTRLV